MLIRSILYGKSAGSKVGVPDTQQARERSNDSLRLVATRCDSLRLVATRCDSLRLVATRCDSLRLVATRCDSLRLVATRCDSLRLVATGKKSGMTLKCWLPSGNLLHSYWKWPVSSGFSQLENGGSFHSYVSLPEGIWYSMGWPVGFRKMLNIDLEKRDMLAYLCIPSAGKILGVAGYVMCHLTFHPYKNLLATAWRES